MRYLWTLTKVLLPLVAKTNIFLLTDGATAIDEAHEFYPDIKIGSISTAHDFGELQVGGRIKFLHTAQRLRSLHC
jgi:hypothetical protein